MQNKIIIAIKQNKLKIGLTIVGISLATGIWIFINRNNKPHHNHQIQTKKPLNLSVNTAPSQVQDKQEQHHSEAKEEQNADESYDEKYLRIINQVRRILDNNNGKITPQAIIAIYKGQYDLANEDIKAITFKARRQRREKFHDTIQYAKIVTKYLLNQQQLQQKHLGAILTRFNIDSVAWKQAGQEWEKQGKQVEGQINNMSELIQQQQRKQFLSLRQDHSKPKHFDFIDKVLKFKIQSLEVLDASQLGIDLSTDDAFKYELIETYVNDLVFQKFGTEPEVIEYSIQKLSKQEKVKVVEYENRIGELMDRFVEVNEEDEKESDFY